MEINIKHECWKEKNVKKINALEKALLKSLTSWNRDSLWDGEASYLSHSVNFFVWSFSNQCTQAVANQSSFCAHCSRLISYIKILLEHSETPHVDFRASFYFVLNSKRSSLATQEISLSLTQRQFHWYHLRKKQIQFHFSVGCSNFIQVQAKEDTATKSCQAIFCFKILDTVLILLCILDRGFTSIFGFTISLKIMWPFPWHNVLQTSLQSGVACSNDPWRLLCYGASPSFNKVTASSNGIFIPEKDWHAHVLPR